MTNKAISGLLAAMAAALAIAAGVCWGGIEVQAEGNGAVSIGSATISGENVIVTAVTSDNPASDDGKYYLFAEKVYQTGPAGLPRRCSRSLPGKQSKAPGRSADTDRS